MAEPGRPAFVSGAPGPPGSARLELPLHATVGHSTRPLGELCRERGTVRTSTS